MTTLKLLSHTHLKIKGNCSLKPLTLKHIKYTGENTVLPIPEACTTNIYVGVHMHFGGGGGVCILNKA